MASEKKITILLTLKGRYPFTLRWLWHANRIELPLNIFIADGDVDSPLSKVLQDKSLFPNLKFEYHQYNDASFLDFYCKVKDALSKIDTEYVMVSDNDDFLCLSGISRSIEFLEAHPDYICAGGGIAHFELTDDTGAGDFLKLTGNIKSFWYQQNNAYKSYDLNSTLSCERVISLYSNLSAVYYNVYRVKVLYSIFEEIVKHNFERLDNAELYWQLRAATIGKLKSDPSYISYLRQIGTSSNPAKHEDLVSALCTSEYICETARILNSITKIIYLKHNNAQPESSFRDKIFDLFTRRMRNRLYIYFKNNSWFRSFLKRKLPVLTGKLITPIYHKITLGRTLAAGGRPIQKVDIFEIMKKNGATRIILEQQEKELLAVETTLGNPDVLGFIETHMPKVLS